MRIEELRSEFMIALVHESLIHSAPVKTILDEAGFACRHHQSVSGFLTHMQHEPPHVVILDQDTLRTSLPEVVKHIHSVSAEIKIVAIGANENVMALASERERLRLDFVLALPLRQNAELTQALDALCSQLYYGFESEQLTVEMTEMKAQFDLVKQAPPAPILEPVPEPEPVAPVVLNVPSELAAFVEQYHLFHQNMAKAQDSQELTSVFMQTVSEALGNKPILFFKYLPAYASLLAAQCHALPLEKIRGIGVSLTKECPLKATEMLKDPGQMPQLKALMREAFGRTQFTALKLDMFTETVGVFVLFEAVKIEETALLTVWENYQLQYQNQILKKRNHDLEVADPLTSLLNRRKFETECLREVDRARRVSQPCSLILLDIDHFTDYNSKNGTLNGNLVLKSIAHLLRRTSRTHDLLVRLENDCFGLLLPHTDQRGASLKAERLRRLIEATAFPLADAESPVTVSMGVSEFPSLAQDLEGLIASADESMFLVKKRGGNRVCVASAPPGFKAEFSVTPPNSNRDRNIELSQNII